MAEETHPTEINKIPIPTWSWLKMNSAFTDFPNDSKTIKTKNEISATRKGEIFYIPIDFENEKSYYHEQIITANENSEMTVILDYTSLFKAAGFSQVRTKLLAKPFSKIHLVKVQLLGKDFIQVDDTLGECDENSSIEVTQIELGGSKIYAQVKNELRGYASTFRSNTAYIAQDGQFLDMNYVVNHYGKKTDTKMSVKGVVGEKSSKTYRGTIDFKRGCTESTGDEQEETLLMSDNAVNKSIPIILCDEENVSGTHGSSIGRLEEYELFYMQSRGIGEDEAKTMMKKAKILSVAALIPNETVISKITDFLSRNR